MAAVKTAMLNYDPDEDDDDSDLDDPDATDIEEVKIWYTPTEGGES